MLWVLVILTLLSPLLVALLLSFGGKVMIVLLIILGLLTFLALVSPFIKGAIKP